MACANTANKCFNDFQSVFKSATCCLLLGRLTLIKPSVSGIRFLEGRVTVDEFQIFLDPLWKIFVEAIKLSYLSRVGALITEPRRLAFASSSANSLSSSTKSILRVTASRDMSIPIPREKSFRSLGESWDVIIVELSFA